MTDEPQVQRTHEGSPRGAEPRDSEQRGVGSGEHANLAAPDAESSEDRLAALEDRLLRTAADFDNYKKRAAREREQYVALANERFVKELLPVLDDLERALDHGEEHSIEEGVRLVHRSLATLLERHGVKEIDTAGAFDPHVHEALLAQPSEAEEGSVIDVVQKGYMLGDRVVRPARVVVAGPQKESSAGGG